jgi:HxlR-like helix-turn-helix
MTGFPAPTGISDSVLSERLAELSKVGLLQRTVSEGPPVGGGYSLTDSGEALVPALNQIALWSGREPSRLISEWPGCVQGGRVALFRGDVLAEGFQPRGESAGFPVGVGVAVEDAGAEVLAGAAVARTFQIMTRMAWAT